MSSVPRLRANLVLAAGSYMVVLIWALLYQKPQDPGPIESCQLGVL